MNSPLAKTCPTFRRPGLIAGLTALVCFAVLVSLCVWQLQRLAWKTALIHDIATQQALPPVPLPARMDKNDAAFWQFRPVTLEGRFLHDREFLLRPRTQDGRAGYHLLTFLQPADGGPAVAVNRGWVDDASIGNALRPQGIVKITGTVRLPDKTFFTPENDAAGDTWYWADIPAMAAAAKVTAAPVLVAAWPQAGDEKSYPLALPPAPPLRNNHLQYALFWGGMAVLLLVFCVLVCGRRACVGPEREKSE